MRRSCVVPGLAVSAFLFASAGCVHTHAPVHVSAGAPAAHASAERAAVDDDASPRDCRRLHAGSGPMPYERRHEGSGVVLARYAERTIAYVADEDDRVLHVVDVGRKVQETTTVAVDGVPGQMAFLADGRLAVALKDRARVSVFEPTGARDGSLERRCSVPVRTEPVALTVAPDDGSLLVASAWGAALTSLDARAADLAPRFVVSLPREPRAVVVSDDGKRAFVAHAVGSRMSVVDLATHEAREIALDGKTDVSASPKPPTQQPSTKRVACQGFALAKTEAPSGRVLAPQVLVDPGEREQRPSGYGSGGGSGPSTEEADVAVVDETTGAPIAGSLVVRPDLRDFAARRRGERAATTAKCLLPRAAATDARRGALFVACVGNDELVEYDATSIEPHQAEKRRWKVEAGPTAFAIDSEGDRAVVWSSFARVVDVVWLGEPGLESEMIASDAPVLHLAMSRRPAPPASEETPDVELGRVLFHTVGDPRISFDGRACASCHPDGRDDAIVWATPDGPRQTPMLAGRVEGTAPYAWSGTGKDVEHHLEHTFQRLRGTGLDKSELDALVAYVKTMRPPPARVVPAAPDTQTALARGRAIFHSAAAGCSSCHGDGGQLPDGQKHDVESKATADLDDKFDTPSLRFVGGTAPYFHDGRYADLRELLVDSDGKMGHTAQLSPADLDALETYLRSL